MSFFKVKILEKSSVFHSFHRFQPRRSRGYHMISYDIIWYHMTSYDVLWCHMTSYDIIWYHMISYYIIWYHMIAAADAAAETGSTNRKPKLFQDFWLWKMTLDKVSMNHKILWNVFTAIRNEILYRKMVGSFSIFSRPGLWPSNFLT